MSHANRKAFTFVELLVAVLVSSILVAVTVTLYGLVRRSASEDQTRADASQNARVALDRITRELRQTPDIVTTLPPTMSDQSVTQPHEIEFEDGHANNLTYKRYYLSGTVLQQQIKEYYFTSNPGTRVHWNAVGGSGQAPTSAVISTQDVADLVRDIRFAGGSAILVEIDTGDGLNQNFNLRSTVERRN